MYQHYARPGPEDGGKPPGHAVAILSMARDSRRVQVLDVNTDYQRLWGGAREEWLGATPNVVEQEAANQQILARLDDALKTNAEHDFEGIGGREVSRQHDGSRRHIEWRITAMGGYQHDAITLVLTQRDVTEQVENEAQLKRLATTDMLTGLVNRSQFDTSLKSELSRQDRYARPLSLIMLDIDYFKDINDGYGHDVGDQVLVELANLLKGNLRQADYCARWGGEEFMLLTPETPLENAVHLADKIRRVINTASFPVSGPVTASFGVVEAQPQESVKSIMKRVDHALYLAKDKGRDQVSPIELVKSARLA
ncbi:diguanylate cyclase [Halomonas sp. SH5A2]|uniref:sensor domain-containing diguanylate cyclase n=1 Tax=Halomonas sp. SH5A2 TaxID=2749040 RepID=UPI001640C5D1|nr:sensor domain-containing diguanylate cyclase [Halomonas sp. SH5A2]QNI04322.1 diguanylate cyclase [Halomonas sp. SH5A2]